MKSLSKILLVSASAGLLLTACGGNKTTEKQPVQDVTHTLSVMDGVIAGEWRTEQSARDVYRNPKETLAFFGLKPGDKVIEIFPGGGWYTGVIAPYIHQTGGDYVATMFEASMGERYVNSNKRFLTKFSDNEIFGEINVVPFGAKSGAMADGDADMILSFRNVHSWMGGGYADKAFADFYAALKPGGVLGIVEHRLPESAEQDPKASTGYVQVSYTKALAKEAGFEFVGASEVNANPKDTADHPFGVWTLPPSSRKAARGKEMASDFDAAKYLAIGESDRYTLKFRKPK